MIKVNIYKQGNYPVSALTIRKKLSDFFTKQGIVSDAQVEVDIVGEKKMMSIGRKYLRDGKLHNVLSFTPDETKEKFVMPPDNKIHLGEIIVCYPVAFGEATKEGRRIEDKVCELIEHGAYHLLGIHHE